MDNPVLNSIGKLEFIIVSPTRNSQAIETTLLRNFWRSHWSEAFNATGAPDPDWINHFDQQDLVVGFRTNGKVIACHLYSFYELSDPSLRSNDYFKYLNTSSFIAMRDAGLESVMTLEYLGISAEFSRNREKVSLGKLIAVLSTYVCESLSIDAALGTPISTTRVHEMMTNVDGVLLEHDIPKYGYLLSFGYMPTKPRRASHDQRLGQLAAEIWNERLDLSESTFYSPKKNAA